MIQKLRNADRSNINKLKYFSIILSFEQYNFEIFLFRENFVSTFDWFAAYRTEIL